MSHSRGAYPPSALAMTARTNLDAMLLRGPPAGNLEEGLAQLRHVILSEGIPATSEGMSDLRMYMWLVLLNCEATATSVYLDLVQQGASPAHAKIQNDVFRTFHGDPLFRRRVSQNSITRVLNAVAWRLNDANEARVNGWQSPPTLSDFGGSPDASLLSRHSFGPGTATASTANEAEQAGYVQGMNVLCGLFLYASRSEVEAFTAFERLITRECPAYVRGSMDGVHRGVGLVDSVLEIVDVRLHHHLVKRCNLLAKVYAFPSVLTMSACTAPLPEVLRLWDFLFAYGPHLNILCVVAQVVMIRDKIMATSSPIVYLRKMPNLNASHIISLALSFASKIPEDMYEQIIYHAK